MSLNAAMSVFDGLPWREQAFLWARVSTAPLWWLAQQVEGDRLADVGCGHGALTAMLVAGHPRRKVVAVDPDPAKVALASGTVGRWPNVSVRQGTASDLARDEPGRFDAAVVCDVLYLVPRARWVEELGLLRATLRPGGTLWLKEAEDDGSWRAQRTLWQERLVVGLWGKTRSSGAVGFAPRQALAEALAQAGLHVERVVPCGQGYGTPHVLFVARKG